MLTGNARYYATCLREALRDGSDTLIRHYAEALLDEVDERGGLEAASSTERGQLDHERAGGLFVATRWG